MDDLVAGACSGSMGCDKRVQGIGIAVVCLIRSIAKREVTSVNEVPSIRRL